MEEFVREQGDLATAEDLDMAKKFVNDTHKIYDEAKQAEESAANGVHLDRKSFYDEVQKMIRVR